MSPQHVLPGQLSESQHQTGPSWKPLPGPQSGRRGESTAPGRRDFDLRLATATTSASPLQVKPVAGHGESATAKPTSSGGTCWRKTGDAAGRWLPPHVRLHVWRERIEQALGTAAARDSGEKKAFNFPAAGSTRTLARRRLRWKPSAIPHFPSPLLFIHPGSLYARPSQVRIISFSKKCLGPQDVA